MNLGKRASLWDRVLLLVIAMVAVYSLALVVAGLWLGDTVFAWLGFGLDDGEIQAGQRAYIRLVYGILGAVIAGWMITLGAIVSGPLGRRERWSWWTIVVAISSWFALDTGLSMLLRFNGHALFNVAFFVALAIPLFAIKSELE